MRPVPEIHNDGDPEKGTGYTVSSASGERLSTLTQDFAEAGYELAPRRLPGLA